MHTLLLQPSECSGHLYILYLVEGRCCLVPWKAHLHYVYIEPDTMIDVHNGKLYNNLYLPMYIWCFFLSLTTANTSLALVVVITCNLHWWCFFNANWLGHLRTNVHKHIGVLCNLHCVVVVVWGMYTCVCVCVCVCTQYCVGVVYMW